MQQNLQYLAFQVNKTRTILFARGNRSIKNIPETETGLKKHILRTILQL